jgi:diacylglycerol kinase family enzyme
VTPSAIPVIYNPTAGGGRARRSCGLLEKAAAAAGAELDWWATVRPGHATELAARAAEEQRPLVLALGGDGTYNEVARGLLGSRSALGILPGGTTSVLAYEFAVPRPVDRAFAALYAGHDRTMRVGETDAGDLFLLMLSAGPDSLVLQRLNPTLKKLGGRAGVAAQAVLELLAPRRMPELSVEVDGRVVSAGWVIVGNAACYGGPVRATPGADPFKPELEVVVLTRVGRRRILAFMFNLLRGRHISRSDVLTFHTHQVRFIPKASHPDLAYQIDGDVAGLPPVAVSVHPQALRVRMPGAAPVGS